MDLVGFIGINRGTVTTKQSCTATHIPDEFGMGRDEEKKVNHSIRDLWLF